jgi:hypothetical protein
MNSPTQTPQLAQTPAPVQISAHNPVTKIFLDLHYDPYRECQNEEILISHILFRVRPLRKTPKDKNDTPQLCHPSTFMEHDGDDFANCHLFSFAAWDHVSWPGNDYWKGCRGTDDGVKAAATNTMEVITGYKGSYEGNHYKYAPP